MEYCRRKNILRKTFLLASQFISQIYANRQLVPELMKSACLCSGFTICPREFKLLSPAGNSEYAVHGSGLSVSAVVLGRERKGGRRRVGREEGGGRREWKEGGRERIQKAPHCAIFPTALSKACSAPWTEPDNSVTLAVTSKRS